MRLLDLQPCFQKHSTEPAPEWHGRNQGDGTIQWGGFPTSIFRVVQTIEEADRVRFLCPLCFSRGMTGIHGVAIDFEGRDTPDDACIHNDEGQPVRWSFAGTNLSDLTLAPSIQILGGCSWHGHIQNGEIVGGI